MSGSRAEVVDLILRNPCWESARRRLDLDAGAEEGDWSVGCPKVTRFASLGYGDEGSSLPGGWNNGEV